MRHMTTSLPFGYHSTSPTVLLKTLPCLVYIPKAVFHSMPTPPPPPPKVIFHHAVMQLPPGSYNEGTSVKVAHFNEQFPQDSWYESVEVHPSSYMVGPYLLIEESLIPNLTETLTDFMMSSLDLDPQQLQDFTPLWKNVSESSPDANAPSNPHSWIQVANGINPNTGLPFGQHPPAAPPAVGAAKGSSAGGPPPPKGGASSTVFMSLTLLVIPSLLIFVTPSILPLLGVVTPIASWAPLPIAMIKVIPALLYGLIRLCTTKTPSNLSLLNTLILIFISLAPSLIVLVSYAFSLQTILCNTYILCRIHSIIVALVYTYLSRKGTRVPYWVPVLVISSNSLIQCLIG